MTCCLNPNCPHPINPDGIESCRTCDTPLIPLLRGRYRILQPLGKGGFSRTYLAEDTDNLNRRCVVKQLVTDAKGNWALQKAADLFESEARQLRQLDGNPQIPGLYGYFEEDDRLYLVQQYIEGENLAAWVEKRGLGNEVQVRQLLSNLLPVLDFIHSRDVIHRDIKPENIICRDRLPQPLRDRHTAAANSNTLIQDRTATQTTTIGDLVLIDFGVSKQLSETAIVNSQGTRVGSDGYAALEQMRGGEACPASDLYSLGVTCFYLLTGIDPFELWTEQGYGWTTHWRDYLKTPISPELGQILDRLLQKDIENRYSSAAAVLGDLNASPHPLPTVSAAAPPPFMMSPRRQPFKKIMVAGVALLLLGFGGSWLFKRLSPAGTNWLTPAVAWNQARLGETLAGHDSRVMTVAASPDGKIIASGSSDRTVRLWNTDTFEHLATLPGHESVVYAVAFSPDGKVIASGSSDKTIKLWDVETKEIIATLEGHKGDVLAVAFSPDGNTLASASKDDTIALWDLETNEAITTLKGHKRDVLTVAFSPDGKTLASGAQDNTVKLWDLERLEAVSTLLSHDKTVTAIAFSRDGKTLATASDDRTVKLWDVKTKEAIATLRGHSEAVKALAVSPDGKTLASGGDDDAIKLWDMETGDAIATLRGHSTGIYAIAFSPDGRFLAGGNPDKTIEIWQVSD